MYIRSDLKNQKLGHDNPFNNNLTLQNELQLPVPSPLKQNYACIKMPYGQNKIVNKV